MPNTAEDAYLDLEENITEKENTPEWFMRTLKTLLTKTITIDEYNLLTQYLKNVISDANSMYNFLEDESVKASILNNPTKLSDLTNDVGFISAITSAMIIEALGYTPGTSNFSGAYNDLTGKPNLSDYAQKSSPNTFEFQNTFNGASVFDGPAVYNGTSRFNERTFVDFTKLKDTHNSNAALDDTLAGKQATLVSGTNIKTINNTSLLGSGNINISSLGSNVGYIEIDVADIDSNGNFDVTDAMIAEAQKDFCVINVKADTATPSSASNTYYIKQYAVQTTIRFYSVKQLEMPIPTLTWAYDWFIDIPTDSTNKGLYVTTSVQFATKEYVQNHIKLYKHFIEILSKQRTNDEPEYHITFDVTTTSSTAIDTVAALKTLMNSVEVINCNGMANYNNVNYNVTIITRDNNLKFSLLGYKADGTSDPLDGATFIYQEVYSAATCIDYVSDTVKQLP